MGANSDRDPGCRINTDPLGSDPTHCLKSRIWVYKSIYFKMLDPFLVKPNKCGSANSVVDLYFLCRDPDPALSTIYGSGYM